MFTSSSPKDENLYVLNGTETIEKIASGENSGYTGGYSAAEPIKITSAEIE